ncbi:P-loop NTPase family protein [Acanthamoeba polyphaga moumouvirus]|uniref:p-loop NTPase family protein n=1 Tax=Acanthamoeba polyphaga moumouvirus TaxID=1269028 RepID=L7RBY4_9VIRU|nr:P-loop NTPase family protein [Acanthamoeba polyphaga moumouvirus]AGC01737.1 P-loop NTPase family protein [Acanthamoeba polyphaga moumouvirus]
MAQVQNNNDKNVFVGPDYSKMIQMNTNHAIIEAFISMLFSRNQKFSVFTILKMVRNMAILLVVKTCLEDLKSFVDKFKFTNLNSVRYVYQRIKFSEVKYTIIQHLDKWKLNDININMTTLSPFLEKKSIYVGRPDNYYFDYRSSIIKVSVSTDKIIFHVPKIDTVTQYVSQDILQNNREIIMGGRTSMHKVKCMQSGVLKFEPISMNVTYGTQAYLKLEESLVKYFFIDENIKCQYVPYCVNFNGEPGTGKTTFAYFIAHKGIFDRVLIYNLVQLGNNNDNFMSIITSLERTITNSSPNKDKVPEKSERILLVLDEIDKWLDSFVNKQIDKLREDSRKVTQTSPQQNTNAGQQQMATNVCNFTKLTPEEEEDKRVQIRTEFLDQLYNVIDGQCLQSNRKYVIIFNTNNFDKLFENCDSEKYRATRHRFEPYNFSKIGKDEIINYLKFHNQMYTNGMNVSKNNDNIETLRKMCVKDEGIYDEIPNNIKISYRKLEQIIRSNIYDIESTIKCLNDPNNYKDD